MIRNNKIESHNKNVIKKILNLFLKLFIKPISYNFVIKKFIKYCSKYEYKTSQYLRNNIWNGNNKVVIRKNDLEEEIYDFEDIKVKGLKDYDVYLTLAYGNYMELPAKENRLTHNFKAWKVKNNDKIKK